MTPRRLWITISAALWLAGLCQMGAAQAADVSRPNILWISCEDISPNLGCFGDEYAVTPNLDRLAAQGVRFTRVFAPIGVCAPARSSLITGMYACSLGTQHMRCTGRIPAFVKCFPQYLREAGYYCTNNSKTDYNFRFSKESWDESSNKAHWRNRAKDQPFFSVFNFTTTHESQIRLGAKQHAQRTADFTAAERHDPAKAPVPPYHPDTPEVRADWAHYADNITYMDRQAGDLLRQLDEDGLADNTLVFFFSDHGAGMPRSKRWLYESSTRVPFILRLPKGMKLPGLGEPGTTDDRLVSFVDLAPTMLSLLGVDVPGHMQGQVFLGPHASEPRQYVYGFRDRMDERYDLIRSVRDARYRYIRNYQPQLPWFHSQYISYCYEMPTMRVWQRLADEGKLNGAPAVFMALTRPTEELYDTQADPWEVHNLADAPEHQETLRRLRTAHRDWMREILDLGLLPEADLRTRFGNQPPYSAVREHPALYPFDRIADAADLAGRRDPSCLGDLKQRLTDTDPAVRYWGATGLGMLGESAAKAAPQLEAALSDSKPAVRVAAADALLRIGRDEPALPVLIDAMKDQNEWIRLQAINVLDRIGPRARSACPVIDRAQEDPNAYVVRVAEHARRQFRTADLPRQK